MNDWVILQYLGIATFARENAVQQQDGSLTSKPPRSGSHDAIGRDRSINVTARSGCPTEAAVYCAAKQLALRTHGITSFSSEGKLYAECKTASNETEMLTCSYERKTCATGLVLLLTPAGSCPALPCNQPRLSAVFLHSRGQFTLHCNVLYYV